MVTAKEFGAYYLFPRNNSSEAFFCAGRLLQEYICSHWATVEQDRLRWLRNNQKTIRADLYSGVVVSCILPPHCLHATFTNAVAACAAASVSC